MIDTPKCNAKGGAIKQVWLWAASDWKVVNGELVLKRKYGKFDRKCYVMTPEQASKLN